MPAFLKARDVLEFATVEGAKANGLDSKIGTLTPGKEADVILLRTDRLNVMPRITRSAPWLQYGPANVDTVLIGGQVKKRDGQLVGVDVARIGKLGREAQERNYKSANVPDKRV